MLLVDTNIWLAAADRRSDHHHDCSEVIRAHRDELTSPVPVVAETSWLLLDRLGSDSQRGFLTMVASRELQALDLISADWRRCAELVERYADLHLDLMDASVVALAERFGVTRIATLDHRDFTVVRPNHVESFELLP